MVRMACFASVYLRCRDGVLLASWGCIKEAMNAVRHRLVQKFVPNELVFVGELPSGPNGGFSPKMDHLVGIYQF